MTISPLQAILSLQAVAVICASMSVALGSAKHVTQNRAAAGLVLGFVSCLPIGGLLSVRLISSSQTLLTLLSDPKGRFMVAPIIVGFIGVVLNAIRAAS